MCKLLSFFFALAVTVTNCSNRSNKRPGKIAELLHQLSLIDSEIRCNNSKNKVSSSLRFEGRLRKDLAFDIVLSF